MLPLNALPTVGMTQWSVFYARGTDWQAWQKPSGCSMVYIFMQAAGGGGSRCPDGNVGPGGGGGGGGSGGASRLFIPAIFLPDTIYVQPGAGGAGATTANTDGSAGATSYVSIQPDATQANIILSQGGGNGALKNRTAGTAGPIGVNTSGPFTSLGLWNSIAGQAGGNGASAINGNGGTVFWYGNGIITSGGSGGGNGTGTAGSMAVFGTSSPYVPFFGNRLSGSNGFEGLYKGQPILPGLKNSPLFFSGGGGAAGGTIAGPAPKGGDASYGGGGGGGGGSNNASGTSGNGGNGGDGFVIIGTF